MKKLLVVMLSLILCIGLCACGESEKKEDPLTSDQIVQKMKDDYSIPIERDTDTVQMCIDYPDDDYRDCTVEVFENESDAKEREDYLKDTWEVGGMLKQDQYMYRAGTALLRVSYAITPDQAKEYEKAFNEIMGVEK